MIKNNDYEQIVLINLHQQNSILISQPNFDEILMLKVVNIKFDSTIYDSAVELDGYSLVRRDRVNKLGEEACVHILNHLFLLKCCLIYKMNASNPYGYI